MNILLPMKSKTIIVNEPPWVNKNLKKMIHARKKPYQRATWPPSDLSGIGLIVTGSQCRSKYYDSGVKQLKESDSSGWWKEIKWDVSCNTKQYTLNCATHPL